MSETTIKGAIAEAAIRQAAVELGFVVLHPLVEGRRYDLVIDTGPDLLRVQCKWAPRKGRVIIVHLTSCRHTPHGYIYSTYDETEIDAFGIYCQELKRCFYVPISAVAGQRAMHLRLAPTANNQKAAIKYADDFDFGAIAQLGERRAGSAKVGGSNPPSSTSNVRPLR
jgi:hypothetical protein